jgi:ADP-ribosylglycohydrolase
MGGSNSIAESARASLYGMFIGDAISMPVHWFYEPEDIKTYFPPVGIQKYEAAPEKHPSYFCVLAPVKQIEHNANEG